MEEITTVGIDLAKSVFQIHAVDAAGQVVVSKAVRRAALLPLLSKFPACLVGMEACASSHHWARELARLGHEVRLMPPAYVKAYVRRQKNDAADAEAICEAVSRPTMRFVPVKSREQQAVLMLHRARDLLVRQRTALINALRGHWPSSGWWFPEARAMSIPCWRSWPTRPTIACRPWLAWRSCLWRDRWPGCRPR